MIADRDIDILHDNKKEKGAQSIIKAISWLNEFGTPLTI